MKPHTQGREERRTDQGNEGWRGMGQPVPLFLSAESDRRLHRESLRVPESPCWARARADSIPAVMWPKTFAPRIAWRRGKNGTTRLPISPPLPQGCLGSFRPSAIEWFMVTATAAQSRSCGDCDGIPGRASRQERGTRQSCGSLRATSALIMRLPIPQHGTNRSDGSGYSSLTYAAAGRFRSIPPGLTCRSARRQCRPCVSTGTGQSLTVVRDRRTGLQPSRQWRGNS